MEDTVTLARQEREKQGPWEIEVSYGGEADLHQHLTGCDKNPGHQNFIPVDQFNVDHLPPGCRDRKLADLVRAMSDLTLRVSVKYVSDSRPETFPGSDEPFPRYKDHGSDMLRTGTGWVRSVDIYPNKYDKLYTTCTCKECVNSPTPKTQFAHIDVRTAAHVVYDKLEADHTTCHLFFDTGASPEVCSTVVPLSGWSVVEFELEKDSCRVRYVTHDLDLADRLKKILIHCQLLSESIRHSNNPLTSKPCLSYVQRVNRFTMQQYTSLNELAIIVSHPHGCSKQVSFGRCTRINRTWHGLTKCSYTTPTCPGSSGAHVYVIDEEGILRLHYGFVHSAGEGKGSQQLNSSSHPY